MFDSTGNKYPYQAAVEELHKLVTLFCPLEKLECLGNHPMSCLLVSLTWSLQVIESFLKVLAFVIRQWRYFGIGRNRE